MDRCGNCNTLSVEVKRMRYETFVKGVGEVIVENFPMRVCSNDKCGAHWIGGEGDQLISDAAEKIRSSPGRK